MFEWEPSFSVIFLIPLIYLSYFFWILLNLLTEAIHLLLLMHDYFHRNQIIVFYLQEIIISIFLLDLIQSMQFEISFIWIRLFYSLLHPMMFLVLLAECDMLHLLIIFMSVLLKELFIVFHSLLEFSFRRLRILAVTHWIFLLLKISIFVVLFIWLIRGSFTTQVSSTVISFLFPLFIELVIELVGLHFEPLVVADLLVVDLLVVVLNLLAKVVFEVEVE